jgi:hypothetical protein
MNKDVRWLLLKVCWLEEVLGVNTSLSKEPCKYFSGWPLQCSPGVEGAGASFSRLS